MAIKESKNAKYIALKKYKIIARKMKRAEMQAIKMEKIKAKKARSEAIKNKRAGLAALMQNEKIKKER